jgi:hypothetical protein
MSTLNVLKSLSESQMEILRWLGRGNYIFYDARGKFRMTDETTTTNVKRTIKSGHGDGHLYRPTVEFFIDENIIVGKMVNNRPQWYLNEEHPKWGDALKELKVQGALGLERTK